MSTRLFIGILSFYILAQIICNFVDGENYLTNADVTNIQSMTESEYTVSTDSSGNSGNFITTGMNALQTIGRVLFFDYTIFKDVDPVTLVETPNGLVIMRYLLIAIGIVMFIELGIMFRSLVFGR